MYRWDWKREASRIHFDVFDEAGVVPVDARTEPGSQDSNSTMLCRSRISLV